MGVFIMINELYHHGILGMRWGVIRKRDNSSGSNKNKSNAPKQKSKHQLALEEKYKSQGYSSSASEVAAKRRIRVERALAITAGVTVAAATAYVVSNHLQEKCDSVIKSTEHLQRIEYSPDGKDLHDVFLCCQR